MIFLLAHGMQNPVPRSPLQVNPVWLQRLFLLRRKGEVTAVRIRPPAFAVVVHGDYPPMGELQREKGIAVLNAASSQEIS